MKLMWGMLKNVCFKLLFISICLSCYLLHGQKTDSILKAARLNIYEKPGAVIKIGDSIFRHSDNIYDKVDGLILISNAYSAKREYQKSLRYSLKAAEFSKESNDVSLQINILSRVAIIYQQLKVYDEAIKNLDECDRLLNKHKPKNSVFIQATNNVVRGVIYKEQLSCDLAIPYFNKAIEGYKKINSADEQPNLSIAAYNRGNCYIQMGDYRLAKKSFQEAIVYAENISANSLKAFAQKGLAQVYNLEGNYNTAILILNEAQELSKDAGDLILQRTIFEGLATNYIAIDNKEKYLYNHNRFLEIQSTIKESERRAISDSIDELTKETNDRLYKIERQYCFIIGIIIFIIILLILILYRYQIRFKKSLQALKNKIGQ